MARRGVHAGDVIRLNVRTLSGWKGRGMVIRGGEKPDDLIVFYREDDRGGRRKRCLALRAEVCKLRDQTWHGLGLDDDDGARATRRGDAR